MPVTFYIISALLIIASLLPFVSNQHWIFRIWEFGRIQLMVLQILILVLGFIIVEEKSSLFWGTAILHGVLVIYHLGVLIPYTKIYRKNLPKIIPKDSDTVSIISINVYQFNDRYDDLIKLVKEVDPDILLTMESNQAWENGMKELEKDYPYNKKVALENTYGIHFYSKLEAKSLKVNYFTANDLPSIEASLSTANGSSFTFFGIHPPPPSPTEEDNSKERDGELLSIGKKVLEKKEPVIVVGDFNNVAWAKSSILFRKTSQLIDPRIGRGFVSTYHAKYKLLRFPIDLFFHSTDIFIEEFKTLRGIGSDHLPLFCKFFINHEENAQKEEVETLEEGEEEEVEEMIKEGIEEKSDREKIATE